MATINKTFSDSLSMGETPSMSVSGQLSDSYRDYDVVAPQENLNKNETYSFYDTLQLSEFTFNYAGEFVSNYHIFNNGKSAEQLLEYFDRPTIYHTNFEKFIPGYRQVKESIIKLELKGFQHFIAPLVSSLKLFSLAESKVERGIVSMGTEANIVYFDYGFEIIPSIALNILSKNGGEVPDDPPHFSIFPTSNKYFSITVSNNDNPDDVYELEWVARGY